MEEKSRPVVVDAGDAVVRMSTSTICGTDLHILKEDVPSVAEGRVLGHEGVSVVEEVGRGVSAFKTGDRVLISTRNIFIQLGKMNNFIPLMRPPSAG